MEGLGIYIVHVKVVLGSGGVIPGLNRTTTFKIFLASVLVQPCQFINYSVVPARNGYLARKTALERGPVTASPPAKRLIKTPAVNLLESS